MDKLEGTDFQPLHDFEKSDKTVQGTIASVMFPCGGVAYLVSVLFTSKEEAAEYFNKAGGDYEP